MAKQKFDTSFNFGANAKPKPKKPKKAGGKPKRGKPKKGGSGQANAWTAYVTGGKRR